MRHRQMHRHVYGHVFKVTWEDAKVNHSAALGVTLTLRVVIACISSDDVSLPLLSLSYFRSAARMLVCRP